MEDSIEVADTIYPIGTIMTMGYKQGKVALNIQDGGQNQNGLGQSWTNVAIPHGQMLLAVVGVICAKLT